MTMQDQDFDWNDALADAQEPVDVDEVRANADLVAVALSLGIVLDEVGERWIGHCPFHDDNDPSFAVYFYNDTMRWGCWPCDKGGGVFDLVMEMRDLDFMEAVRYVAGIEGDPPTERQKRVSHERREFTEADIEPGETSEEIVGRLIYEKGLLMPPGWLADEFNVIGTPDGAVAIPHLDAEGKITAIKYRRAPDWTPMAARDSRLDVLYGSHRDRGNEGVVLVEGESDTWTTAWLLRNKEIDVLGLPSGAKGPREEWIRALRGREVTLMFDADTPARRAVWEWASRLGQCRIAVLDEGEDVSSTSLNRVWDRLKNAYRYGTAMNRALLPKPGVGLVKGDKEIPVLDGIPTLKRVISIVGEDTAFEIEIGGRDALVTNSDVASESAMRRWANRHGRAWYGSNKDAQEFYRILWLDAPFVQHANGTRVAGWHDDGFVLPDARIGPGAWVYVPPVADAHVADNVSLDDPGNLRDRSVAEKVVALHDREVITPIIGWIAASPLRAWTKRFPVLGVVGGSGAGKSTTVEEVLTTFGFGLSMTLTQTTPHAIHSLAAATNGIPIWFDEYRQGMRIDAKMTINQTIRDAWESSSSVKGGLGDNRQALTYLPARAPLLISGEDAFSETSHVERMVIVTMPSSRPGASYLTALRQSDREGFGRIYLEWLVDKHARDEIEAPPDLPERMEQARAIVEWGWELFSEFAREVCSVDVGEYDGTLVEKEHAEAGGVDPTVEGLSELLDQETREGCVVWQDGGDVCVRVAPFCKAAQNDAGIQLPGGYRAVRKLLQDQFDTTDERSFHQGRYLRLLGALDEVLEA